MPRFSRVELRSKFRRWFATANRSSEVERGQAYRQNARKRAELT